MTVAEAQKTLAKNARERRLSMALTQENLAEQAGVSLATLRRFEQSGLISLEAFLKLYVVLGGLEDIVKASRIEEQVFASIDEVLAEDRPPRQRGLPRRGPPRGNKGQ